MVAGNALLTLLLGAGVALSVFWAFRANRKYRENILVAKELERLVINSLDIIEGANQKNIRDLNAMDLESPGMLATILTVVVSKFGDIKLSMDDFMIPDGEYVSVYVNGDTKELILSTNHNMVEERLNDPHFVGMPFSDPDDSTYH
jgi:hypothetical protein